MFTAPLAGLTWFVLALWLALAAGTAHAQTFPKFTGLVTDAANVIPADREAALEARLEAFQRKTGRQLVVATVPSLGDDDIQDYGYKLGRAWGVGLKGADNGAILLIAPAERKIGIEVGTGLEGVLTDAYSSVIIQSKIVPAFKAGDMPGGIDAGAAALGDLLAQPDDQARAKEQAAIAAWNKTHAAAADDGGSAIGILFALLVVALAVGLPMLRLARGRRFAAAGGHSGLGPILLWTALDAMMDGRRGGGFGGGGGIGTGLGGGDSSGGGWSGGGFTGGGGGSFGGGGASGGW